MRPRFSLSLRTQLALVALTLLALPWAGYRYVREMERFLFEGQAQAQIATARAIATALHDRPQLMRLQPVIDSELRREAEEELKRLAVERGEAPAMPAAPAPREIARESAPREQVAEVAAILKGLERTTARIWVVNRDYRVLALAGSLKRNDADSAPTALQGVLGWLIQRPTEDFDEAVAGDVLATGRDIAGALQGASGSRVRNTPDGRAVVVSAAHPIWNGEEVLGAVVVEETTNAILSVRSRALERLLLVTLTVFALAAAVLLAFATRLSNRIRKLRDEAESAIDAKGHITRLATGSNAGDEIGDLSRSFSAMLSKLARHHTYLESMASRLSHELRTPIAVVRSSLENLRLQPDDARVYIERAEEGLKRLSTILTRMSEATRLEQGLASQESHERERFDLAAVVKGCVEGYRGAYIGHVLDLVLPEGPLTVDGAPDLVAQLLDKLVANAVDFSVPESPIVIALSRGEGMARLSVCNRGPLLPEAMRGTLFESMISVRKDRVSGEPHLGLGLYIARLIAEFHGGSIRADNLLSGVGVEVSATFRLAGTGMP